MRRKCAYFLMLVFFYLMIIIKVTGTSTEAASLRAPVLKSIKVTQGGNIKISWGKNPLARGYLVYRSIRKNDNYKLIKTINSRTIISYIDKTAVWGKTYYYKVRAFKTYGKNKTFSRFSGFLSIDFYGTIRKPSIDEFSKEVTKLKLAHAPRENDIAASADFFASGRLLVKGKQGRLDFSVYHPLVVLEGPDDLYILQFKNASSAKKAYRKIIKLTSVIFVEPDEIVALAE